MPEQRKLVRLSGLWSIEVKACPGDVYPIERRHTGMPPSPAITTLMEKERAGASVRRRRDRQGATDSYTRMVDQLIIWPDPVPCRPENPVQGINRCVALETNIKCPWLDVDYCGIRAEDMADSLSELGLGHLSWVVDEAPSGFRQQETAPRAAHPDPSAYAAATSAISDRQREVKSRRCSASET